MNDDAQPTRVIVRAMSEFMIRAVQAKARPLGGDMLGTVVLATIQNANFSLMAHNPFQARRAFEAIDSLTDAQLRPVSINAVARSFAIPYETARGATARLIKHGCCVRTQGGVIVPIRALVQPDLIAAEQEVGLILDETLARLSGIGFDFGQIATAGGAEEADVGPPPARLVSWIATDFVLRAVENLVPIFGDFTAGFIFAGVMSANARAITYDPEQAWIYAGMDTPPPDAVRRPVSIRSLSEQLGIPFETVRRHVNLMATRGFLVRADEGVIAPTEVLQRGEFLTNSPMIALRFARMIADLKRAGYVFPRSNAQPRAESMRAG